MDCCRRPVGAACCCFLGGIAAFLNSKAQVKATQWATGDTVEVTRNKNRQERGGSISARNHDEAESMPHARRCCARKRGSAARQSGCQPEALGFPATAFESTDEGTRATTPIRRISADLVGSDACTERSLAPHGATALPSQGVVQWRRAMQCCAAVAKGRYIDEHADMVEVGKFIDSPARENNIARCRPRPGRVW